MGQEIFYCWKCKSLLRTADLEKGRAVRSGDLVSCKECAEGLPGTQAPVEDRRSNDTSGRLRALAGTAKHPRGGTTRRIGTPEGSGFNPWLIILPVAVVAMLAGALLLSTGETTHPPPVPPPPPSAGPPPETRKVEPEIRRPPPVRVEDRSAAAAKSLEAVQRHRKEKPDDVSGAIALARAAALEADGTGRAEEARKLLREFEGAAAQKIVADLRALDGQIRAACGREEYGAAIEAIAAARGRWASPEWSRGLDEQLQAARKSADERFAALQAAALDARRRGADVEVKAAVDRLARWRLPDLEPRLAAALVEAPPAAPPRAEFDGRWTEALSWAEARIYATAVELLEGAARALPEGDLRAEAMSDLDLLRAAQSVWAETLQALAKWPRAQKLAVEYRDLDGALQRVEDAVLRSTPTWAEVRKEKGSVFVEFSEISAGSVADLFLRRREGRSEKDARAAALFLLVEGQPEAARTLKAALPPKYWDRAARPADPNEAKARAIFSRAEQEFAVPGLQGRAAGTYRQLLDDFGSLPLVRRHRGTIAARAEAGREYLLNPEDLKGTGTFRRTEVKGAEAWVSGADSEEARIAENAVEAAFWTLPEKTYRCWALLGGCCAEALAVHASDGGAGAPLKHSISPVTKLHARHTSRTPPVTWAWVEVPLSPEPAGGMKRVRLMTARTGTAVQAVYAGCVRGAPPAPADLKEFERQRHESPPELRLGNAVFHRAIDLGGAGGTIDGHAWEGRGAPDVSGSTDVVDNQSVALIPPTDPARAAMIRTSLWSRDGSRVTVSGLPPGTYRVFLYTWEETESQTFDLFAQGKKVQSAHSSGAAGHWDRLGPWTCEVTDGKVEVRASPADANFCGLELWRIYR